MSGSPGGRLRVALIDHGFDRARPSPATSVVRELAGALSDLGHEAAVLTPASEAGARTDGVGFDVVRVRRLPEAPLRLRGFTGPLTQIPFVVDALRRGRFDIAHAFSAIDAQAALLWRRLSGTPAVFTCCEPPAREHLADRRGQLRIVSAAFESSDHVSAATTDVQKAIDRWLALDVPVISARDGAAYEEIYLTRLEAGRGTQT